MIREEPCITTLRFYHAQSDDPFAVYAAVCTLVHESPKVVWIKGMHGGITRPMLREMCSLLMAKGIETIKCHRDSARRIPLGKLMADGSVVVDLMDYANSLQPAQ